jgi:hypothetical protein
MTETETRTTENKAEDVLLAAADAIGERAAQRDLAEERSMARTVAMFNSLTGADMSEREGWVFQALLKLSRAQGGSFSVDDYIDGAAYIALAAESVQRQSRVRAPITPMLGGMRMMDGLTKVVGAR